MGYIYGWSGDGDGSWQDANDWEGGPNPDPDTGVATVAPGPSDSLEIDTGAAITGQGSAQLMLLYGSDNSGWAAVTFDGADISLSGGFVAVNGGSSLTLTDGATVSFTNPDEFGFRVGGEDLSVMQAALTVAGADTSLSVDGEFGAQGAIVTVLDGGSLQMGSGEIETLTSGEAQYSHDASLTVSGQGSNLVVTGELDCDANTTVDIDGGASLTANEIYADGDTTITGSGTHAAVATAFSTLGQTVISSGAEATVTGELSGINLTTTDMGTVVSAGSIQENNSTIANGAEVIDGGNFIDNDSFSVMGANTSLSVAGTLNLPSYGGAYPNQTATIENGASVTIEQDLGLVPTNGATATMTVTGQDTSLSVGGTIYVGGYGSGVPAYLAVDGPTTLNIANDATVDPSDLRIAPNAAPQEQNPSTDPTTGFNLDNVQTVSLTGDATLDAGEIAVGQMGNGELTVNGGTVTADDGITIGDQAGSQGQLIFDGANAPLVSQDLTVGNGGKGLLNVGNGNTVRTSGDASIGAEAGSSGLVTIADGTGAGSTAWSIGGNLTVGEAGTGTLAVNPQASLTLGGNLVLGADTGSKASAVFSGGTLAMQSESTISVGESGNGVLLFQDGATEGASTGGGSGAPSAILGETGGSGTLTVSGAGSTVVLNQLEVGNTGSGSINVNNGGELSVDGDVDLAAGVVGRPDTIKLDTGALMTGAGDLTIGAIGPAGVVLTNAAELEADGNLTLGEDSSASAAVSVTAPVAGATVGTTEIVYGKTLTIGDAGVASLTLSNGGVVKPVSVGDGAIVIAAQKGSQGTVSLKGTGSRIEGTSLSVGGTATARGGIGKISIATGSGIDLSGTAHFWNAASLTLSGGDFNAATAILDQGASITGHGTLDTELSDNGFVTASGGLLDVTGSLSGGGEVSIKEGASLELDGGATGAGIAFKGDGTLILKDPSDVSAAISGFAADDTIALEGINATSAIETNGVLDIFDGSSLVGSLNLVGNYQGAVFDVNTTGANRDITLDPNQPNGAPTPAEPTLSVSVGSGGIEGEGGAAVAVPGISVADKTADATITAEVFDTTGMLSVNTDVNGGGGTISLAPDTTTLTISGSLSEVNADLSTLTYEATAAGSDTIDLFASDSAGNSDTGSVSVTVPDQAPSLTLPASQSVTALATTPISGLSVSDSLSNTAIFTVTLSDQTGTLAADQDGTSTVTGSDTDTVVITGDLADVNDDLAAFTYSGASTGLADTDTDTIVIAADDGNGGTASGSIDITVDQAQDQTPYVIVPASESAAVGATTPISGISVVAGDTTDKILSVTLSDTGGLLSVSQTGTSSVTGVGSDDLTISGDISDVNADLATLTYDAQGAAAENDTINIAASDNFGLTGDGSVAVAITAQVACYCPGTRIRTAQGDVPVEALAIGDMIETASGGRRPIKWLGHQRIDCRRHSRPQEVMPVRIRVHALGDNKPARDLLVSPRHSLCLDILGEVLIPAGALINGATIVQEDLDRVTYWHVELDSHDLLVAENQPAESYLDMGNRGFFIESKVVDLCASPDADLKVGTYADFCRPFYEGGVLVEAARAQLRLRAEALGWRRVVPAPFAEAHLEVDGRIVQPDLRGLSAQFVLSADAQDVWLVSPTSVPSHVEESRDERALGLSLHSLRLDDGWCDPRIVALEDPLLCEGIYRLESELSARWRWTAGRARLPAALWAGLIGSIFLRVDINYTTLPRWVAPEAGTEAVTSDAAAA